MAAPMASTANERRAIAQTGGEGEWIADPLDAAISIFCFMPGMSLIPGLVLPFPLGRTVIMPCFR